MSCIEPDARLVRQLGQRVDRHALHAVACTAQGDRGYGRALQQQRADEQPRPPPGSSRAALPSATRQCAVCISAYVASHANWTASRDGRTRCRAAATWAALTSAASSDSRIAASAASLTKAAQSAAEKPSSSTASLARSTSDANGTLRDAALRISARACAPGGGTYTRRSKRPGRSSAGSTRSGRFVAPITTTLRSASTPSSSVSSEATTRSVVQPSDACPRTARSLSPTHLLSSSAPLTDRTLALPVPAIALTR